MWAVAVIAALYVAATVVVVGRAGLNLRAMVWDDSRSITFEGDIGNAYRWGGEVDSVARQASGNAVPTFWQLVRAEGKVYRNLVDTAGTDAYELDYPPLRLLTMSLWRRHINATNEPAGGWPSRRFRPPGESDWLAEKLSAPLITMNTCAEAATAILIAVTVGIWNWRGGIRRRTRSSGFRLAPPDGVLAFIVTSAGFFYAIFVAVSPSPAPPPAITITRSPAVFDVTGGSKGATIFASINPQGSSTKWLVRWGEHSGDLPHVTPLQSLEGSTAAPVSVDLTDLPPKTTIYYRVVARNGQGAYRGGDGRGTTRSDEATLVTDSVVQPPQPTVTYGAVWLSVWQWVGVAILFITLCWSIRRMAPAHRAWAIALVAGVVAWFDPTMLINAHIWPQWDVCLLPPFVLAVLLVSLDCWFSAGLVMGVGMMFKGQFLIGSPVLLLLPIVSLRWGRAARLIVGITLSAGLILSPWIVLNDLPPAENKAPLWWIGGVLVAAAIGITLSLWKWTAWRWIAARWADGRQWWRERKVPRDESVVSTNESELSSILKTPLICAGIVAAVVITIVLMFKPWPANGQLSRGWGAALLVAIFILPLLLKRRSLGFWAAAVLASTIWMSPWLFHGDWSWKTVGFEYGTQKFDRITMGPGSNGNLPGILAAHYHFDLHDPALTVRLPDVAGFFMSGKAIDRVPQWMSDFGLDGASTTLDLKQTMIGVYGLLLLLCAIGAAIQSKRRDPRFLAAMVAPWALMPNVLCQMMSRYHIWGAVLSTMLLAIAPELLIVHVVMTLMAAGMVGCQLMRSDPSRSPELFKLMNQLSPDSGWVTLSAATFVLLIAITPGISSRISMGRYGRGSLLRS